MNYVLYCCMPTMSGGDHPMRPKRKLEQPEDGSVPVIIYAPNAAKCGDLLARDVVGLTDKDAIPSEHWVLESIEPRQHNAIYTYRYLPTGVAYSRAWRNVRKMTNGIVYSASTLAKVDDRYSPIAAMPSPLSPMPEGWVSVGLITYMSKGSCRYRIGYKNPALGIECMRNWSQSYFGDMSIEAIRGSVV